MNPKPEPGFIDRELDLRGLLAALWRGKWFIAASTLIGAGVAIAYALLATEIYRSEALVQPRKDTQQGGGLGSLATQFGALAGFASLSFVDGGDRAVTIATLKSRALVEPFIVERNLMPKLFSHAWDTEAGAWKHPDRAPTTWEAYNVFTRSILKVSEDKRTGLLTIAVEWTNAEEAQQWVTELISRTNAYLKSQAIEDGERNLTYLQEQAVKSGLVEVRQSLYGLIETEMKRLMMAKGSEEYAMRTIDAAVVPKRRLRPKRKLIAALGFAFGLSVGVLIIFFSVQRPVDPAAATSDRA